jgi:hypothetical protein
MSTPDWRIDELRAEAAEHQESGASGLPADRARFIVEVVDRMRAAETEMASLRARVEQHEAAAAKLSDAGLAELTALQEENARLREEVLRCNAALVQYETNKRAAETEHLADVKELRADRDSMKTWSVALYAHVCRLTGKNPKDGPREIVKLAEDHERRHVEAGAESIRVARAAALEDVACWHEACAAESEKAAAMYESRGERITAQEWTDRATYHFEDAKTIRGFDPKGS